MKIQNKEIINSNQNKNNQKRQLTNAQKINSIIPIILQSNQPTPQLTQHINTLFQLLLWAEKKSPQNLINTLQLGLLQQIMILQIQSQISILQFIKSLTLLFGNCVQSGILITHLLQASYGDQVFKNTIAALNMNPNCDPDSLIQYIGSFLKAYAKHLNQKTLQYYIKQGKCLLAQTCCNFYNCPQQLTKTTVINIVLSIFQMPNFSAFLKQNKNQTIQSSFYLKWAFIMVTQFRNNLIFFDSQMKKGSKVQIQRKIQQLNDLLVFWEDITANPLGIYLFRKVYLTQILHPILGGSMSKNLRPVFSLKFGLLILNKMLGIIINLQLLRQLIDLLFMRIEFGLHESCLSPLKMDTTFDIFKVASRSMIQDNWRCVKQTISSKIDGYKNYSGISQFFTNILKSRDNQFILLICRFLMQLMQIIRKGVKKLNKNKLSKQALRMYDYAIKAFNLDKNNTNFNSDKNNQKNIYNEIIDTLINQLHAPHSLKTLQSVSKCIVHFQFKVQIKEKKQRLTRNTSNYQNNNIQDLAQFMTLQKTSHIQSTQNLINDQNSKFNNQKHKIQKQQIRKESLDISQQQKIQKKQNDEFQRRWDQFAQLQKNQLLQNNCQAFDNQQPFSPITTPILKIQHEIQYKQSAKQTKIQQISIEKCQTMFKKSKFNQNQQQGLQQQLQHLKQQFMSQNYENNLQQSKLQQQPSLNYLQHDLKNKFIFLYRTTLKDAQKIITQTQIAHLDNLAQIFQYDLKNIQRTILTSKLFSSKVQQLNHQISIFLQIISSNLPDYSHQQYNFPFLQSIPDTPQQLIRYKIAKFLLIRRLRYYLIQGSDQLLSTLTKNMQSQLQIKSSFETPLLQTFYKNVLKSQGSVFKPGTVFRISQLKHSIHPCKLIDGKNQIDIALIDDQNSLIIGHVQKERTTLKILMNLKMKHINSMVKQKGGKAMIDVIVKNYNSQKGRMQMKSSFSIRGFQIGLQYIPNKKHKFMQKQLHFILRLIKRCEKDIPQISLI